MGNDRDLLQEVLGMSNPEPKPEPIEKKPDTEAVLEDVQEEVIENQEEVTQEVVEEAAEGTESDETEKTEEEVEEKEESEEVEELKPLEDLILLAKEINPDGEFADEKSALEAIKEDLKEKNEFIEKSQKWNNELIDLFESNPEVGEFTKAVINGMDPKVAAGIYISETLAPEDGEESYESFKEELKKRKEALEQRKEYTKQYSENVNKSKAVAEEFQKEFAIDQDEFGKLLKEVDEELTSINKGLLTKSFLALAIKGKTFDQRIKKAEEQGYLRGKNEKIKLEKTKKNDSDGLPDIKSGLKPEKELKIKKPDLFDRIINHQSKR